MVHSWILCKVNLADVGIEKIGISNVISTAQLNDISLLDHPLVMTRPMTLKAVDP